MARVSSAFSNRSFTLFSLGTAAGLASPDAYIYKCAIPPFLMGLLLEKRTVIDDIGGVRIGQERYIGPESMVKIPWLYSLRSLQTVKRVRNAKFYNVTNLSEVTK